jgi:hypothetical protein
MPYATLDPRSVIAPLLYEEGVSSVVSVAKKVLGCLRGDSASMPHSASPGPGVCRLLVAAPHAPTACLAAVIVTRRFPIISDSPAIARSIRFSISRSQDDDMIAATVKRTSRKVRSK